MVKSTKGYNVTDLSPLEAIERHVVHRDMQAHIFRFLHVLNQAKIGDIICDFGCGNAPLFEVLYRNRFRPKKYIGLDIRYLSIKKNIEKFKKVLEAQFEAVDLIKDNYPYHQIKADKVCSFEVLEHVGKQNALTFLEHFKACGNEDAIYYLSTPCYDEHVGAAGNHTYDAGDGRGKVPQEFSIQEIKDLLEQAGFDVCKRFGTFASQRDYKPHLNEWQRNMFDALKDYYDSTMIANIFAPLFPDYSRNNIWVLKKKSSLKLIPKMEAHQKVIEAIREAIEAVENKIDKLNEEDPVKNKLELDALDDELNLYKKFFTRIDEFLKTHV
jgi:cyclopropane fatty-acyl-phospholipid synthase-like methyltransferase